MNNNYLTQITNKELTMHPLYSVVYIKDGEIYSVLTPKHTIASAKKWFRHNIGYYTIIDIKPVEDFE